MHVINYMLFCLWNILFFFFKQKTAYEMLRSLVGSEMCIRDSDELRSKLMGDIKRFEGRFERPFMFRGKRYLQILEIEEDRRCLLYTSDAADEEDSVDLGGRRIIKKKKKKNNTERADHVEVR
eukprot:TRINITY_DN56202_c0_g1_i1.p1 TRINITY_DN56202_c0_g1~~TRINITY_DN56202_c0_g1_i1.p1  ORF type:complete len:123 (+),score=44.21 TRINITY_DN56202_c0_g1_i1:29-397(+)